MQELDDNALLREYVEHASEEAFALLVTRHINKVYSVALRHTRNAHLAEEMTQSVFGILAQKARNLGKDVVISGWLYQTARLTAMTLVRSEIRRTQREQEAHMQTLSNDSESSVWPQIEPLLDTAMAGLNEMDRHAVVLRFFDGKSMKEVGIALGGSEDAAKMRVNRAVEKLRLFFTKNGIVLPAAALTSVISANAVQSAPIGLAATLSTAALAGTTLATAATATVTKAIAMTTLQKAFLTAIVIASVAAPLVLQYQAQARLRDKDRVLQERAHLLAQLEAENQQLSALLAQAKSSPSVANDQFGELLRLRGEVARLRQDVRTLMELTSAGSASGTNVLASAEKLWAERVNQLKQWVEANPSERIPELQFMTDSDWVNSIYPYSLETPEEYGSAMSSVRGAAESRIVSKLHGALQRYAQKNNGQLPTDLSQITAYLDSPIQGDILQRYEILPATNLVKELQGYGDWVITQKAPVNEKLDSRQASGLTRGGIAGSQVTNRWVLVR